MKKLALAEVTLAPITYYPDDEDKEFFVTFSQLSGEEYLALKLQIEDVSNGAAKRYIDFRSLVLKSKLLTIEGLEINGQKLNIAESVDVLTRMPSQQLVLDKIFNAIYRSSELSQDEKNA